MFEGNEAKVMLAMYLFGIITITLKNFWETRPQRCEYVEDRVNQTNKLHLNISSSGNAYSIDRFMGGRTWSVKSIEEEEIFLHETLR